MRKRIKKISGKNKQEKRIEKEQKKEEESSYK